MALSRPGLVSLLAVGLSTAADEPEPTLKLAVTELNVANEGGARLPVFFQGTELPEPVEGTALPALAIASPRRRNSSLLRWRRRAGSG